MEKDISIIARIVRFLIIIYLFSGCLGPTTAFAAVTECNLIQKSIDKLGKEMSVQRTIISSNLNPESVSKATSALKMTKHDYNLAQKAFKKAKCRGIRDNE